ncbi:MAG: magnesium/cobalt transporter CorA [Thiotrichales bacterium]
MALFDKRFHPPGTTPGTLHQHEVPQASATIRLIEYDLAHFEERLGLPPDVYSAYLESPKITWIHVQGPMSVAALDALGTGFGLHPLALEDISNSGQRPKLDLYPDHLFLVLTHPRMIDGGFAFDQVSLFFGQSYVVSFHDGAEDLFEAVRERLRHGRGKIRARGADYLLYALIDTVVDGGFPVLEAFGAELEALEESLLEAPTHATLQRLHLLRRDALLLRRALWPQRETVSELLRDEASLLDETNRIYFRDCHDHAIQILDLLESYREMTTSMLDLYLSSVSFRLNEIMRVLTVIATIFIPLTFIAGVYGMNFGDRSGSPWAMPELDWYYGYPALWGIMIAIAFGMIFYFKRKHWF